MKYLIALANYTLLTCTNEGVNKIVILFNSSPKTSPLLDRSLGGSGLPIQNSFRNMFFISPLRIPKW